MRVEEIRSLTGLRAVAAAWVVLMHAEWALRTAFPRASEHLHPVVGAGAQGVDLFFILSGYVLALNYASRLGERSTWRGTRDFLVLRLARVWPVYLLVMHVGALWIIVQTHVGDQAPSRALTAEGYLRQLFMVQLWGEPGVDPSMDHTSWVGPAWTISAEWLAYLAFPLLAVVVWRAQRVTRARTLLALAVVAALPPVLLVLASGQFYTEYSWLTRILCQFTAGVLACLAVQRLRLTEQARRTAGWASLGLLASIVGLLFLLAENPVPGVPDSVALVNLLFVPWVVTLAVGTTGLPRLLGTRFFVWGGVVSFSLYLVHALVFEVVLWLHGELDWRPQGAAAVAVPVVMIGVSVLLAHLVHHRVEEPARLWIRAMVRPASARQPAPGRVPVPTEATAAAPAAGSPSVVPPHQRVLVGADRR